MAPRWVSDLTQKGQLGYSSQDSHWSRSSSGWLPSPVVVRLESSVLKIPKILPGTSRRPQRISGTLAWEKKPRRSS